MVKEMGLGYKQQLAYIGSEDSIIPSSLFYTIRRNLGGFKRQYLAVSSFNNAASGHVITFVTLQLGAMVSSVDDLLDELDDQYYGNDSDNNSSKKNKSKKGKGKGKQTGTASRNPFSPEKIANMLNIEADDDDQVEGNLIFNMVGGKRFFTFDNTTVENLPQYIRQAANILKSGKSFSYTKLYDQYEITLAFPTAMGLPFVYTLKTPTLVHAVGEVTAKARPDLAGNSNKKIDIPDRMNATADIHFVFSSKTSSKISFVTPWDHKRYIAGLDKNIQVNLPVRMALGVDTNSNRVQLQIKPLYPRKESMILHFSVWPYTAKHDILDLQPVSRERTTDPIHIRDSKKGEMDFGRDSVGLAFKVKYSTEAKFIDAKALYDKVQRHDAMSLILYPWVEKTIERSNFSLFFDGPKSEARSVTLTADYGKNIIYLSFHNSI
jgi:hypothetical protein